MGSILVISGGRGVGKTTFCRQLVELGRALNLDVAGLLSPARFSTEPLLKTGIEVEDLRTGQRRLLASSLENELNGVKLGDWTFDDQAIEWGNRLLGTAAPCDLLVIDELGPLEFDRNQGWSVSFDVLDARLYRLAVIVVRPEYLERVKNRWLGVKVIFLTRGEDVRSLAAKIIEEITHG